MFLFPLRLRGIGVVGAVFPSHTVRTRRSAFAHGVTGTLTAWGGRGGDTETDSGSGRVFFLEQRLLDVRDATSQLRLFGASAGQKSGLRTCPIFHRKL